MALPDFPLTRGEQYLNRTATGSGTIPDEPLTRVEMYLNKIATGSGNTPDEPLTRVEMYLYEIAENGGGGSDITLETLNVTENGTINAPSGTAYNKVVANVPNSYAASDEGKVVSNGSLVSQTAHAEVTTNGTIDTTLNNSVVVAVPIPSGGGGEAYELHSVQITLASNTAMVSILNTYVKECSSWRIYPTDAENTSLNTIAIGTAFINDGGNVLSPPIMPTATSATGVALGSNIPQWYVNDQTYNAIRTRGTVAGKAAGSYQLDFYGVAV